MGSNEKVQLQHSSPRRIHDYVLVQIVLLECVGCTKEKKKQGALSGVENMAHLMCIVMALLVN